MNQQSLIVSILGVVTILSLTAVNGCKGRDQVSSTRETKAQTKPEKGPQWRPGYERPPVIDMHSHLNGEALPLIQKTLRENGIASIVNLSGGGSARSVKRATELHKRFPRVLNFYSPIWRDRHRPGFGEREAQRLELVVTKHGYRGLKISKALGLYLRDKGGKRIPVDWPELAPLWNKAGELGVPVAIHTADPKAFWEPISPENERFEELELHPHWSFAGPEFPSRNSLLEERNRVFSRHPKTTFIGVHFGNNPEDIDAVARLLDRYPNMMLDTSARVGEIGRHDPKKVNAFFTRYKKRIVFGTDIGLSPRGIMLGSTGKTPPTEKDIKPFYEAHWRFFEGNARDIDHPTPIQGRWKVHAIGLSNDVLDHIYWKNAMRLLKMKTSKDP